MDLFAQAQCLGGVSRVSETLREFGKFVAWQLALACQFEREMDHA